jgi:hypothetical protein
MNDAGSERFIIDLQPVSDRYDGEDSRWRDQVAAFYRELDQEVGGVSRETTPVAGTKGGIETVILALGSAGAFTAAVQFFQAWLGRDRTRSLSVKWRDGEEEHHVTLKGEGLDQETLRAVAAAAAARIAGDT